MAFAGYNRHMDVIESTRSYTQMILPTAGIQSSLMPEG